MPPLFMDSRSEGSVESLSGEESNSSNISARERGGRGSGDGKGKRRQTNRNAARKSRKKQTQRADSLHQELQFLERSNSALEKEIASLRQDFQKYSSILGQHEPSCPLTISPTNSSPSSSFVNVLPSSSSPARDPLPPSSSSSCTSSSSSSPLPPSRASGLSQTSVEPPLTAASSSPGNTHPPRGPVAPSPPCTARRRVHLLPTSSSSSSCRRRRHGNAAGLLPSVTDARWRRRSGEAASDLELRLPTSSSVADTPPLCRVTDRGATGTGLDPRPGGTGPSLCPAGRVKGHGFPGFSSLMTLGPCPLDRRGSGNTDGPRSRALAVPFSESVWTPEVAPATAGCPPASVPDQSNAEHSLLSLLTFPSPLVAPPTTTSDLIAPPTGPQPITPWYPVLPPPVSSFLPPLAGPAADINLEDFLEENDWLLGFDMLL